MTEEIPITRVVDLYSESPFVLRKYVSGKDEVVLAGDSVEVNFVIGLVPLDCLDDISKADRYNPRRLKETHRDDLMDQIGTYGLVYPLVTTLERTPVNMNGRRLFLIDGRHRFNGLLELDPKLKKALQERASELLKLKRARALSDPIEMKPPRHRSTIAIRDYKPPRERLSAKQRGAPLIPVKIYVRQGDVDRIGMAVFLNRGQKRLAGGEQIAKIAIALEAAIKDELERAVDHLPSELKAVEKVLKSQARADQRLVVLSQHVAKIMEDEESPWFPLIGRWQGEVIQTRGGDYRRKPLTANNFLAFSAELIDDRPLQILDDRQRTREIMNLNRLGELHRTAFNWPEDIPNRTQRHTATSVLCRSFLIRALGSVLNERHVGSAEKLLSSFVDDDSWVAIEEDTFRLQEALQDQATKRAEFEDVKRKLRPTEPPPGKERRELLGRIDALRGPLWTLDTVIPALKHRLETVFRGN